MSHLAVCLLSRGVNTDRFLLFCSSSPLRYHLRLMRHKKVPLQTVISLKAINKSSPGNWEEIVGYELEQTLRIPKEISD